MVIAHRKRHRRSLVAIILTVGMGLAAMPPLARGQGETQVYGKTYGEWSAQWWQWAHSIPASSSPVLLEGNVDCTLGQRAPVYFLAGKAAQVPEDSAQLPIILTGARTCTIPQGVALFFPIVNAEIINAPGDTICTDAAVGRPCTVEEKRQILDFGIIGARNFCGAAVTLDGTPPYQLATVRTQSPPYKLVIGADDVLGAPPGTVDTEVVSDGFWMLVPPLPRGPHTLTFKGSFCLPQDGTDPSSPLEPFFSVEMTYNLTVGQ
jgi:hypothetical protein